MKNICLVSILLWALALIRIASGQDAGEFRIGTGVGYSTGSYGETEETDILSIPLIARYSRFPWTVRSTLPWTRIEGPEDVVLGTEGPLSPGTSTERSAESGLGDWVMSVTYSIDPWTESAPSVDLTAKVKVPTADEEKRLGTGETDYSLQVELSKSIGEWSPFIAVGYQFMGSSDAVPLDDRAFGSLGVSLRASRKLTVGVAYDARQSASESSDDSHEIGVFSTWRAQPHLRIAGYASFGLSDGAPDWSIGLQTQITVWN